MLKNRTKADERREAAYRKQLKTCGFRSWKAANNRRHDLISKKFDAPPLSDEESKELEGLQVLADKYLSWKDFGNKQNMVRRAKYVLAKYSK